MEAEEKKNEKPFTVMYFSNEIKSQLKYYNLLGKKMNDLNAENRKRAENIIHKYKDQDKAIERGDFAQLKQLNMLFASVANDIQATITKLDYIRTIALSGFGIDSFDLTKEENEFMNNLCSGAGSLLFKIKTTSSGEETLEVRDADLFEIIKQRSWSSVPDDQKQLKEAYNIILVEYNAEVKREQELKAANERRMKQLEETMAHEEELKKYGKETDESEDPDTEG